MNKKVLVIVLLLVVGFASVATTLAINGITHISHDATDFRVYFSNALVNGTKDTSVIKDDITIEFAHDMSLIDEVFKLEYEVTNGSKNYDAAIVLNFPTSNEYLRIENDFDSESNLLAKEKRNGILTITVIKPYDGTEENYKTFNIVGTITATPIERTEVAEDNAEEMSWKLIEDSDNNNELSIGDLISYDTENFYIYSIDGDNIKAISQYNLYVGSAWDGTTSTPLSDATGLQDARSIGAQTSGGELVYPFVGGVIFGSNSTYEGSVTEGYVKEYMEKLNVKKASINEASLITLNELKALGCDEMEFTCNGAPGFIHSTSYWTRTDNYGNVYVVVSDGSFDFDDITNDYSFGVRPVITISKSLF